MTSNTVLSFRVLSCSNRHLIIQKAGSTGTEVNKAVTSYELNHSPSCEVTFFACSTKLCVLWMWWDEEYIGETSRTFGERFKEHLKDPSPIHHNGNTTKHLTTKDNFQIIGREDHGTSRTITESIYIRVNNPTLNRNIGKFNLHHMWDRVLLNTPGLKINRQVQSTPPSGILSPPT